MTICENVASEIRAKTWLRFHDNRRLVLDNIVWHPIWTNVWINVGQHVFEKLIHTFKNEPYV
jgi:hypothetical protein